MLRLHQFSILGMLVITAVIAGFLALGQYWQYTAVIVLAGLILVCNETLIRSLPKGILRQLEKNCIRADGSWSERRADFERRVVKKLHRQTLLLLCAIVIPSLFLLWIVDRQIAPLAIGTQAISGYNVSPESWKANLVDDEQRLDTWHQGSMLFRDSESHKQFLWRNWPMIVGAGIGWLVFCGILLKNGYLYLLKEVNSAAHHREHFYQQKDFSRVISRS